MGITSSSLQILLDYPRMPLFSRRKENSLLPYNSMDAPNEGIYIMDANGKDIIRLSGDADQDSDPAWSLDGKWIIFTSDKAGS